MAHEGRRPFDDKSLVEIFPTDSLEPPKVIEDRGFLWKKQGLASLPFQENKGNTEQLDFKGDTLSVSDWEDCLATKLSRRGWMWSLGYPCRNSAIQNPCRLGPTYKYLGHGVLSDLELDLLVSMEGPPVLKYFAKIISFVYVCI